MRTLTTLLSIALLLFSVACRSAPEPAPRQASAPTQTTTADQEARHSPPPTQRGQRLSDEDARELSERITDEDLTVFARGVRALAEREAELVAAGRDQASLEARATSPIDVAEARQTTLREMESALEEVGLRIDPFLQMAGFIRQNPLLMERLQEHLTDEEIQNFYGP